MLSCKVMAIFLMRCAMQHSHAIADGVPVLTVNVLA